MQETDETNPTRRLVEKSRRVAILKIEPRIFVGMCTPGGRPALCIEGLPAGAVYRGFAHDYQDNTINIFVEHESFEDVPMGQAAPIFPAPLFRAYRTKEELENDELSGL